MTDLREQVARAIDPHIWSSFDDGDFGRFAHGWEHARGESLARADAALAAMPKVGRQQQFLFAISQLRHLYAHLSNGTFSNAKELADGLLSPQIAELERMIEHPPQHEVAVYGLDGSRTVEMRPVPLTAKGQRCCSICEAPLDIPNRPWTRDCGGDCFACMADVGDPDALAAMPGGGVPVGLPQCQPGNHDWWGTASTGGFHDMTCRRCGLRSTSPAAPTPPAAAEETM